MKLSEIKVSATALNLNGSEVLGFSGDYSEMVESYILESEKDAALLDTTVVELRITGISMAVAAVLGAQARAKMCLLEVQSEAADTWKDRLTELYRKSGIKDYAAAAEIEAVKAVGSKTPVTCMYRMPLRSWLDTVNSCSSFIHKCGSMTGDVPYKDYRLWLAKEIADTAKALESAGIKSKYCDGSMEFQLVKDTQETGAVYGDVYLTYHDISIGGLMTMLEQFPSEYTAKSITEMVHIPAAIKPRSSDESDWLAEIEKIRKYGDIPVAQRLVIEERCATDAFLDRYDTMIKSADAEVGEAAAVLIRKLKEHTREEYSSYGRLTGIEV